MNSIRCSLLCVRLLLALSCAGCTSSVLAQPGEPAGMTSVQQALKDHQFDKLDAYYLASQKAYREGRIADVELLRRFSPFDVGGLSMDQDIDLWVAQFPKSYAAHLSRGMHLLNQALIFRARSYKYDAKIRNEIKEDMEAAGIELETSLKLEEKPVISYAYLILDRSFQNPANPVWQGLRLMLARSYDFRIPPFDDAAKYLKAANQIAPDNFVARSAYLRIIRIRWGISSKNSTPNRIEDDWFLDECRSANLSPEQMKALEGEIQYSVVKYRVNNQDPIASGDAWRSYLDSLGTSAELIDPHERAFALMDVASGQAKKGDLQAALASLNQAISLRDDVPRLWALKSYYLGQLKDPAWVAAAETASGLGDAWAEYQYGAYLAGQSKNPNDIVRGRKLEAAGIEAGYRPN